MMRTANYLYRIPALTVVGLMVSAACAFAQSQELSGTYISDKEATLDYLRSTGVYSPEQLQKIGSVMGRMKVTFNGDTVMTELDEHKTSEQFKIVERGSGYITILTNLDGESVQNRIEFVSDGYWLVNPPGERPFREKFRRVP